MSKNNALLLAVCLGVVVVVLVDNQNRLERELAGTRRRVSDLNGLCAGLTGERDALRSRAVNAEQDSQAKGLRIGELEAKMRQLAAAAPTTKQTTA
jgi:uncharacterized protein YoxC